MWFTITLLQRRGKPLQYVRGFVLAWLGNLLGALFFAFTFAYAAEAVKEELYRFGITSQVTVDIVNLSCYCIFLRAIGCGFLVTLAMFLGTQNNDGISKTVGLHLPVFISKAVRFPHTAEYMYLTSLGMMLGAKVSFVGFFWRAMLPISLGNTVGGAVFMGLYEWWVFLYCGSGGKKIVTFAGDARLHWQDGEDGDD
jgi:formate/nitrite transporter FocA (FNT family)